MNEHARPIFDVQRWLRFLLVDQPALFIPISYVVKDWQNGELAEDIWRYEPQAWGGAPGMPRV